MTTISTLAIDDADWERFTQGHPEATTFHCPEWARVVSECYGFRALAVVVKQRREIVAGFPAIEIGRGPRRRWVSLPFTDRCIPLLRDIDPAEFARRIDDERRSRDLRRIELRDNLAQPLGYSILCGHWHELELSPGAEELYAHFHRLRRRLLRRAEENAVVVERGTTEADLCEVFFRLHVATRRRLGVPVQPRRLFELLWRRVIEAGLGFVMIARIDDTPIAAGVFLTSHGRITAKFSATDREHAAVGGMDALYWQTMRWGCEHGYRVFDFGRTETGNEGLRRFKLGWGTREKELRYTVYAGAPPKPATGRAEATLGAVIRRSPPWVARTVGRTAYRFAA